MTTPIGFNKDMLTEVTRSIICLHNTDLYNHSEGWWGIYYGSEVFKKKREGIKEILQTFSLMGHEEDPLDKELFS